MAYKITMLWEIHMTLDTILWFTLMCILIWIMRSIFCAKALSQYLHWYGFSVLCVLICGISSLFSKNSFLHWLHWYGFSPVWFLICLWRSVLCEKCYNCLRNSCHFGYNALVSSQCVLIRLIRILLFEKVITLVTIWLYHIGYTDMVYPQYVFLCGL